jgi:hypothetical protein
MGFFIETISFGAGMINNNNNNTLSTSSQKEDNLIQFNII